MAEKLPIKLTEELLEDLQCPVCFNIHKTIPIYQCVQGHVHCKDCHPRLQNCPICRSSIGDTRALMTEKLIASLPDEYLFEKSDNQDCKRTQRHGTKRSKLFSWLTKFGFNTNQNRSKSQIRPLDLNRTGDQIRLPDQNKFEANVTAALSIYRGLKKSYKTNGNLVCLNGTIPVNYRNQNYNIPIEIILWNGYPDIAPLCYVRPTSNMKIKETPIVTSNGKIVMSYLLRWNLDSDILGLIRALRNSFGQFCPLFAKSSKQIKLEADLKTTLEMYPGLKMRTRKEAFPNEREYTVTILEGTIPVPYKNNQYNIPIEIQIFDYNITGLTSRPDCYVKPAPGMIINESDIVDFRGKISLPYLQGWDDDNSDIFTLVQMCIIAFSEKTPLYRNMV